MGRVFSVSLQPLALQVVNSLFLGDYLTSEGQSALDDLKMIRDGGFEVLGAEGRDFVAEHEEFLAAHGHAGASAAASDAACGDSHAECGSCATGCGTVTTVVPRKRGVGTELAPNA